MQGSGRIDVAFLEDMLEHGYTAEHKVAWGSLMEQAFVCLRTGPFYYEPAAFSAKLRTLDILLKPAQLQQLLVRPDCKP